jgi:thiamine biosynthesis protein ThiS
MTLTVTGEARPAAEGVTIADLLRELRLEAAPCAVEVNRAIVPKAAHGGTVLADGDQVEIVTLVGGG